MTKTEEMRRVAEKYAKYGITFGKVAEIVESGRKHGFDFEKSMLGARMALAHEFHEDDYFTVEDVCKVTGESPEWVLNNMETLKAKPVQISIAPWLNIGGK